MKRHNTRNELVRFLKANKEDIISLWSGRIFRVPGHRRLKDIISRSHHSIGMRLWIAAFIRDINSLGIPKCEKVLRDLIFNSFLSVNTAEDVIHGMLILRGVILEKLLVEYENDIKFLQQIASIVIGRIDKVVLRIAKLYKKKDFEKLHTIMMYGKRLISIQDIRRLYNLIIRAAVEESDADRASLMLLDSENYLYIKSAVGIPQHIISYGRQKLGTGISGMVAKEGKPIIINEGSLMPSKIKSSMRKLGLASAVSIPLHIERKVIGVLNLGKFAGKPLFDKDDMGLLSILAAEAATAISNCRLFNELQDLQVGSIISLAEALDARDHYTKGHSSRVMEYSVAIAKEAGLSQDQINNIQCASLLHDIGKIGIPDSILNKKSSLTRDEYEIIKKHPVYSRKILQPIPRLKAVIPIVYHEHERWDGRGYVEGLKGNKIPIESRIISIADAYEAMTSKRPYRNAMTKEAAIKELKAGSGKQFDPYLVNIFFKVLKKS